jgi:hypothetical protein
VLLVVVGWREVPAVSSATSRPVGCVGGPYQASKTRLCRKSSIAARSGSASGTFKQIREGGPVNGGSSDVVSGGDAKQQVVRGGREKKIRRPCVDDSGRRGSWRARKRTGSRT